VCVLEKQHWPEWWDWELELSSHSLKRMVDRRFNEVDLRAMLENAISCHRDVVEGRWLVKTMHLRHPWEVIIEPDYVLKLQVVITAYPVREE
jgi:hypothetical protein